MEVVIFFLEARFRTVDWHSDGRELSRVVEAVEVGVVRGAVMGAP